MSVLFARNPGEMRRRFDAAYRALAQGSRLWIAWRKQESGDSGGLMANSVRAYGLQRGLVDFKICAVDETWSGLCFTHRRRKLARHKDKGP